MTSTQRFTAANTNNDNDDEPQTKEEIAEEAKVRAEKLKIAVVCLLSYFVIGVVVFCFVFESWTFSDAMYMLMVTLVTVGYGDKNGYPTTQAGRLFHTFFVLYGISIVAVALVEIANFFLEKREAMLKEAQAAVLKNAADNANTGSFAEATLPGAKKSTGLQAFFDKHRLLAVLSNLVVYAIVFGAIFGWIEDWSLVDGAYWSIVTGTTVGYGDISPQTVGGRWACFFFLPFSVIFVSTNLSELAGILLNKAEDGKLQALLKVDLSLEALLSMDQDGDGEITEYEFIKFMLTTAGMADEDTLDSLHKRFQEMDADGSGALDRDDIELLIKQKTDAEEAAVEAAREAERKKVENAAKRQARLAEEAEMAKRRASNGR